MIESVLATDMSSHQKTLASLKTRAEMFDISMGKNLERMIFIENPIKTFDNQQAVLSLIIHAADISNPAKPAHVQKTWVDLVFIEFYKQGDTEKQTKLPISLLCDRSTTDIDKSQIGFMNYITIPTFETLMIASPELQTFIQQTKSNLKRYEELKK